jgi:hypothetical protein
MLSDSGLDRLGMFLVSRYVLRFFGSIFYMHDRDRVSQEIWGYTRIYANIFDVQECLMR